MTPTLRRLLLAAAGSSAMLIAAGAANAQDTASTEVEEIVVTAQKREQASVDVPLSLTAYSGERLRDLGIQDFADLSKFTPGFEVQDQSPNNPGYVMRGITSDSTDAFSEPRVSVFQDGVSISKAQGSYVELFDIERVEVAKGPQSTLFGRGALIGAVNIIQNKADPDGFDASLTLEGGDHGYRLGQGMLNIPLSDVFALRLGGSIRQRDGYVDNALPGDDFQGLDSRAARFGLAFEPTDSFRADLIFNYQEDATGGTAFKSINYLPTNPTTGQVLGGLGAQDPAAIAAPAGFQGGKPLGVDRTVRGVTGLMVWDLSDDVTLTSISAWRDFDSAEVFDADGVSLPILTGLNDATNEQFSQELRLNYDAGGRIRGFVGASYFSEESVSRIPIQIDERVALGLVTGQLNAAAAGSGLPANNPAPLAFFGNTAFTGALVQGLVAQSSGGNILLTGPQAQAIAANLRASHLEEATTGSELTSFDLFADVSVAVTERFELSAGVRYTSDDRTTSFASRTIGGRSVLGGVIGAASLGATGTPLGIGQGNAILGALQSPAVQLIPTALLPNFGVTFQPTANNGDATSATNDESDFTWRLVGRYALSDDANLYASYARGRRPAVLAVGGPAAPYGAARFDLVEAETVDSFEVGYKAALFDRSLRLDTAVYYYDYDNFQTVEQQGTLFVITNAGKAKAYGFEGQAEWRIIAGLDVYATYAWNQARFDGGAYDGNSFRLSPDHTASIGANWKFDALGGEISVRPSYSWQSKVFFDDNNDRAVFQQPPAAFLPDNIQDEVQDSYGLVDLRVGYKPDAGSWTVGAFVTNLTDESYIIDAGNTGDSLGLPTFIGGRPRMWGVTMGWKY